MQRRLSLVALLFSLLLLGACQTTSPINTQPVGQEPIRTIPVNVQTKYISPQAIAPQALDVSSGNLFNNSGFESGIEGWTACSTGAIKASSNAYAGSGALEIISDNCFYRSAEVSAGDDLILSCYAKVLSGSGWTGMGLGFADSSWTTIDVDVPSTVITGSDYARYDVKFTAPANTKYASMWLFSENPAVIDNCSLMLEAEPPPPPPSEGNNFLDNGEFETLVSNKPTEWSIGCGGYVTNVAGRSGKGLSLTGGVCADQGLSASDIAALSNQDFTYSCYAKNTSGYASLSIFFDNQPTSKQIPVSNDFQLIEIKGTAPQASGGFVSVYSNGNLIIDDCSLTVANQDTNTCVNPVNIPDTTLQKSIRGNINKPTGVITCADMLRVTDVGSLDARANTISSLEGLQFATNLRTANFNLGPLVTERITDLSPLTNLTNLKIVRLIRQDGIRDFSPLASLVNLEELLLGNIPQASENLFILENLNNLKRLSFPAINLDDNDLFQLIGLENLTSLELRDNPITNIDILVDNPILFPNEFTFLGLQNTCLDLTTGSQASQAVTTLRNRTILVVTSDFPPLQCSDSPKPEEGLLENGAFERLNSNSQPTIWEKGCGGSYSRVIGRNGNGLSVTGGACVDQALSSDDLSKLASKEYTYSCYAKNTGGYASMSIFFDEVPQSIVIPVNSSYQLVEIKGTAPQASNGFVSVYSSGNLTVDECSLVVDNASPPPPVSSGKNLLENSGFADFTNWDCGQVLGGVPTNAELIDLRGMNKAVNISNGGTCKQTIPAVAGSTYTLTCTAKLLGSNWASIQLLGTNAQAKQVTDTTFQGDQYTLTGQASGDSVTVQLYAEDTGAWFDSCWLANRAPLPLTSESQSFEILGRSFDIEGNRMVVGVPTDDTVGENSGKVEVYSRVGDNWVKDSDIFLSDAIAEDGLGTRVYLKNGEIFATSSGAGAPQQVQRNLLYNFSETSPNNWILKDSFGHPDWVMPPNPLMNGSSLFSFGYRLEVDGDTLVTTGSQSFAGRSGDFSTQKILIYNRNGQTWELQKELIVFRSLIEDILLEEDMLLIGTSSTEVPSSTVAVRFRNAGGQDNWGSVQSLFQADGRVGDSSFGRELSRTGNLLIIDGVAGAAIYKRSTNSEMPWERLGKFEDLLPGLVPQNLTPYASPDGNRLFFTTSTRNENGSPLASSAITYVVDSSDADFSNWTVIQKLSPQNVSSTDIFATSTNIAENNRYYFGVFDSVFKRILTFEIQ